MNVLEINDVKELKALAYDQLALRERIDNNLAMINGRIAELDREGAAKEANKLAESPKGEGSEPSVGEDKKRENGAS